MEDFIKGSSVVATVPTLLYVGYAQYLKRRRFALTTTDGDLKDFLSIPHELLPVGIAIVYGISYAMMKRVERDDDRMVYGIRLKTLAFGFFTGLLLSLIGRFGLGLPTKLFDMSEGQAHTVHFVAPILYMAIFVHVDNVLGKK